MVYFWIGLGSALGGMARYWCTDVIARLVGETFPWGTVAVNVFGCGLIGLFATLTGPQGRVPVPLSGRLFFMTGVCGGYTTFSAFSLQTLNLARDGEWAKAVGNAAASLLLCLAAVWLGHVAATALNQR